MSYNSFNDRLLSCEDDEFVLKVDTDIRGYIENHPKNRTEETEFTWRYVNRNSVPKSTNCLGIQTSMGVENAQVADAPHSQTTVTDIELDQSVLNGNSSSDDPLNLSAKKNLSSRTRRPDRAVYVPRAKRSQTTPPASTSNQISSTKSHLTRKSDKSKSKSVDENHIENPCNSYSNCAVTCENFTSNTISNGDIINQNDFDQNIITDSEKNQKNLNNFCTMSEQATKELIIETAAEMDPGTTDKVDKDEKELIKASQEINRSNRKLIKQTFNSNVLEIEACGGEVETKTHEKAVNKDEDDWDTLFDDNGDCLDPKMLEELTTAVGKVNIEKPKSNYKIYQANVDLLSLEEFPHVLECSNFPAEFRTQDLMLLFSQYKESGFDIKWVDDTHCLVIFSSSKIAADVLTTSHSFVKLKPLNQATVESRSKAKKCAHSLQPYKQRPETCAALAKRLVSGALGVRVKATSEERENERRVLREAKDWLTVVSVFCVKLTKCFNVEVLNNLSNKMNNFGVFCLFIALPLIACGVDAKPNDKHMEMAKALLTECKATEGGSDSDLEKLISDSDPGTRSGHCMVACANEKIGLIKDGKLNKNGFLEAAKIVTSEANHVAKGAEIFSECEQTLNSITDRCDLAVAFEKCFHDGAKARNLEDFLH
ncbi:CLUMA_CG012998, isoform B [Clunio marinus]|uniref:CLUMA_CG012998, isoform B n=1 Tax=Clunio marinus TaxID=568069 RepID=A0A1J1IKT8_9DIPT|nr:CLUMA_CG012998, isoform B [Clunio marinus]